LGRLNSLCDINDWLAEQKGFELPVRFTSSESTASEVTFASPPIESRRRGHQQNRGEAADDFGQVRGRLCDATRLLNRDFAEQKPFEKPF
jgi:hypothetical protein